MFNFKYLNDNYPNLEIPLSVDWVCFSHKLYFVKSKNHFLSHRRLATKLCSE